MNDHDPLTCTECSPEPWSQMTVRTGGRGWRVTGWSALFLLFGPVLLVGFLFGLVVGAAIS